MPAARHLLLQLLPAAAASAGTLKQQLLQQLLHCVVSNMCDAQSMRVGEVLQYLQHLPVPSEEHHRYLLEAAYRDGEERDRWKCSAVLCCLLVPMCSFKYSIC
jgi:hypothetical protein